VGVVKRSVSFEAGVWDDIEREVGSGPVSPLVNEALAMSLSGHPVELRQRSPQP
jgi:hypothetical protein